MNPKRDYCEACFREDTQVKATVYCYVCSERLCEDCERHHKKSKLSSNHKLIDIGETLDGNFDHSKYEYLVNLTKCPTHCTEEVKYFCRDHDQLCCNECAIVTHRKCEDIVSLADEMKDEEENGESNVQKRLETIKKYSQELIMHERRYLVKIEINENDMKDSLVRFGAELDAAYNKMKSRLMLEASERKEELLKVSSVQKESAEKLNEDVNSADEKLRRARTIGTNLHIYLFEREMCKQVQLYEETCGDLREQSSKTLITLFETSSLQDLIRRIENVYKITELDGPSHSSKTGSDAGYFVPTMNRPSYFTPTQIPQMRAGPRWQMARTTGQPGSTRFQSRHEVPVRWRNSATASGGEVPGAQQQMTPSSVNPQRQVIIVSNQVALTGSMLAAVPSGKQKQMLGERLFPLIQHMYPDLAGMITGMFIEQLDNTELLQLLESKVSLNAKVEEAVAVLQAHQAKKAAARQAAIYAMTNKK